MAIVLLVEDEIHAREGIARFLESHGYEVVSASNGREALAALVDRKPDLVLLDMILPEMDGVGFLRVMRSYVRWTEVPVIVLTGIDDEEILGQIKAMGVKQIFKKGQFAMEELLATMSTLPPDTANS